jgi:hypothetical protein
VQRRDPSALCQKPCEYVVVVLVIVQQAAIHGGGPLLPLREQRSCGLW